MYSELTDAKIPLHRSQCSYIYYDRYNILRRSLSSANSPRVSHLLGKLTPGINWHVRQDQKYLEPTPIDEFREKNRTYIEKNSIDEHWEMMLDEILAEDRSPAGTAL